MSQTAFFNLPDVGEGLTEAEIVTWKVKVGDRVSVNQIIVEIETAKSLVELPCPFEGVVTELLAKEGDTVEVGKPIIAATVAGMPDSLGGRRMAIRVAELARAAALSLSQLERLFSGQLGLSVRRLVLWQRLRMALLPGYVSAALCAADF